MEAAGSTRTAVARRAIVTLLLAVVTTAGASTTALAQNRNAPRRPSLLDANRSLDGLPPIRVPRILPDEQAVEGVEVRAEVRQLAERLANVDYAAREAAMAELMTGTARVDELCALLAEDGLEPEQRARLIQVVQDRLRTAPRGAVGIRMMWRQEPGMSGAVEVTDLLRGLPAEEVLEIGDQITQVDGRPLNHNTDLIVLVQSKRPGDVVKLNLNRLRHDSRGDLVIDDQGKVVYDAMEVALRLGSADQLRDPSSGAQNPSSAVEERRSQEAMEANWRYGRNATFVPIEDGHENGLIHPNISMPTTEVEVAAHRAVTNLEVEIALIDDGQISLTEERSARWADELAELEATQSAGGLSDRETSFLELMIERYRAKMR